MTDHTWEMLVDSVRPASGTLAHHLLVGSVALEWGAGKPKEFSRLTIPSNQDIAKAVFLGVIGAEERAFFLTVSGGRVWTMHGLREATELNATGGRYPAFGGDLREIAGHTKPPDLYEIDGITT